MSKQTITQWVYMTLDHRVKPDGEWDFSEKVWHPIIKRFHNPEGDSELIYIGPVEVEVVIPANFNPTAHEIAALEAKKAKATEAFNGLVREINERISKLQAIGYEAAK